MTLQELFLNRDFEEITQRFQTFLARYEDIFTPTTPTRKVVSLAKKATDIRRTLRYLTHSGSGDEVHMMRTKLIELVGVEDLKQIIALAFLETLNRFDPERGVPLEKFIYNYYPYLISAELINIASPKQILNTQTTELLDNNNIDLLPEEQDNLNNPGDTNNPDFDTDLDIIDEYSELDYRWVEGTTCGEPFTCLTPLERKILLMIYREKHKYEEVGEETVYHFSSIKRKKNEILVKLRSRLEELGKTCD